MDGNRRAECQCILTAHSINQWLSTKKRSHLGAKQQDRTMVIKHPTRISKKIIEEAVMSNPADEATEREDHFWEVTYEEIGDQVTAHVEKHRGPDLPREPMVIFSAWPCHDDDEDSYTNNLANVAVEGRIQMISKVSDFWRQEGSVDYTSEIVENPTWLDMCLLAYDMMMATGDHHHVFLEAVHKTGSFTLDDKSFVMIYDFSMGS